MAVNPAPSLDGLLDALVASAGSDLHLAPGRVACLRVQGNLRPCPGFPAVLSERAVESLAAELMPGNPADLLAATGSCDGAFSFRDGARFRYNVYRRSPGLAIAVRRLEETFRPLSELGLRDGLYQWCDLLDGLVLVAGPTGSGKSTTLATLIDRINRTRQTHIISIEDPIEYLHASSRSLVDQRQIGIDAPDFQTALVAALRQDPDVILVGEVRERETIRTALAAAETGHLVFTTVHAPDCVGALRRIVSVFPADEQPGILLRLAMNLRGVLAQHLVPADGPAATPDHDFSAGRRARVLLSEVLQNTPAVAHLVVGGKFQQIASCMETGAASGMQTLEENLLGWVKSRHLTPATALACTRHPGLLRQRLARLAPDAGKPDPSL